MEDSSSVLVGVRIRPQAAREIIDGCQTCTSVTPLEPQVCIGSNGFTFDSVHDSNSSQEEVFNMVVPLVDGCLEGYNATILAYGQTGSGKTYTMGTGFETDDPSYELNQGHGIIPRAVSRLFDQIKNARQTALDRNEQPPTFTVKVQFVELHNEELNDLISAEPFKQQPNKLIKIHEQAGGGIFIQNATSLPVGSVEETMKCLRMGALMRTTASTKMNDSSSRSHAIFTLHVRIQKFVKDDEGVGGRGGEESIGGSDMEVLSAKFHFVDLAGSERLKRTGAVGERAREGISINCGLLALGNVISALGDRSKKVLHVPYRDSKITRLLQDSLGGNSRTIMIACISPCDRDFVETLNTLKYANRARNIKNKVTVNQDKSSRIISALKEDICRLEAELKSYREGKVTVTNGEEIQTDLYHENSMLSNELEKFRIRVKALQETVERLTASNAELISEGACSSLVSSGGGTDYSDLVRKYTLDIEQLRAKLLTSEATCELLKKKQMSTAALLNQSLSPRPHVPMNSRPGTAYNDVDGGSPHQNESVSNLISAAHAEIRNHELHKRQLRKKLRKRRMRRSGSGGTAATNGSLVTENNGNGSEDSMGSSEGEEGSEDEEDIEDVGSLEEEIVNINDQIDTKQRLIDQLELSNQRALDTKEQYEQQIKILVTKIKHTEEERDSVLTSLKPNSATSTNVKQIKEDFEAKLAAQTRDLNRMKAALKEHNVLIKKNAATEKQVDTLKSEVEVMKKLKVKFQLQVKNENTRFREADAKRQKEILQLKKEHRKKEVEIRTLQSKDKLKDQILKRKLEEVSALKKQNKNVLSRRAGGRLPASSGPKRPSPAKAKKKWAELESVFEKRATDRRLLEQLELEMLKHIQSRKKAHEEIEQLELQLANGNLSEEDLNRVNDEIDSHRASLVYSDDKISQNQRDICELTSGSPKAEEQIPDISLATDHLSKEDCGYLMQKMYEFTMDNVGDYKEAATKLCIAEEQVANLTLELVTANELLSHVFGKYCANDPNLSPDLSMKINSVRAANRCRTAAIKKNGQLPLQPPPPPPETNGQSLGNANAQSEAKDEAAGQNGNYPESPTSSVRRFVRRQIPVEDDKSMARKARRLTSSRKELMGDLPQVNPQTDEGFLRPGPVDARGPLFRTSSLRLPRNATRLERRETFVIPEQSPTTDSLNNVTGPSGSARPLSAGRAKTNLASKSFRAPSSAPTNGVAGSNSEFTRVPTDNFNADTTFVVEETLSPGTVSAPGSPGTTRKVVNENVFQRLTSTTSTTNIEQNPQQGSIRSVRDRAGQKSPFQLTHIANGHSKAVLDICVTEDRLFTCGKDSAVKLWDLKALREITSITTPAIVSRVRFDESSQLLYCVSGCYVRIYDVRRNQCINTLSSAGICTSTDPSPESYLQFPDKEQQILAIAVTPGSRSIYTSYGQSVRLWDMRSFTPVGIIPGKHQSNVMCMESESGRNGSSSLVTGAKDHCIKVYSYSSGEPFMNISVPPKATLIPPHYDGIECFALSGSTLLSGSRDFSIKKWDLSVKEEHHIMGYPGAHSGWVTGLCLPPSHPQYFVSASRDGLLKVWNKDSTQSCGQVPAHKGGVNCLAANKNAIFTGSNEGGVSFWKLRNLSDSSGESSSSTGSPKTDENEGDAGFQ